MTFSPADIADMTGKVVIVTGSNTGIGYITALELSKKGAHVIMACRDESRANAAIANLQKEAAPTSVNVEFMPLDLNSLASVREFSSKFQARKLKLDVLVNNAGIMAPPTFETTQDGFERQIGVNHIGHFELTRLLLPTLKQSSAGRVVCVSSLAHKMNAPSTVTIDTFKNIQNPAKYSSWSNYGLSKLANVLFVRHLSKKLTEEGCTNVQVNALHPGVIKTELMRQQHWLIQKLTMPIAALFFLTPAQGALTSLYCAGHKDIDEKKITGKYFVPYAKEEAPSQNAQNDTMAKELWELTEKWIAEKGPK